MGEETVCVLFRPHGTDSASRMLLEATSPFELYVRVFGPDDSCARRLIDQVMAWDAAGCPTTEHLYVEAYPFDANYAPYAGEIVIPKKWMRFVFGFDGPEAK